RDNPFITWPMDNAKVRVGSVNPSSDNGVLSIAKLLATGASWAMVIRPPDPTITNMAYINQNGGDLRTSAGVWSYRPCGRCADTRESVSPGRGARNSSAVSRPPAPWPIPTQRYAV